MRTIRRILRHVRNRTDQPFRVIDISDVPQGPLEQMGTDWRNILTTIDVEILVNAVARIPEGWITDMGREFASEVIRCGFEQIVGKR